jgi:hypothetical protein
LLPADALAAACAVAGLDSSGAEVVYQRANTVYKLASMPVIVRLRYTSGSTAVLERLSASVRATQWLYEMGFPAVRPLDVPQPVAAHGFLVTFWHFIPTRPAGRDIAALAGLLRQLHTLPVPPVALPATAPVHGDAHPGNLIHALDRVVLCDWDAVSHGPREQDLIPVRLGYRYGRPEAEWGQLCNVYQVNPSALPLMSVLERMRELRAVAAYLRLADLPQARAEASHRIGDLMSGTQREAWQALNLASRQAN